MKFENVSVLTTGIKDIIKHMRYCWVDRKGMICEQRGVFRVNCVDCLDRTNVVQTAIARIVMETQCRKLGLLAPDENLPENCRKIFQQLWANTGDAISKQYAGTAALKGDFTRTGERKITGMMKDGVNSANRYYLRFKDTYRQAAIDVTHGQPVSEDILSGRLRVPEDDVREMLEKEENVKQLIEDCKKMLIVEPEECLGGWGLINADPVTGDSDRQEIDIILLLSQRAVYVAWYDDEEEQVNEYQRIFLEDIEKLEIGAEHSLIRTKSIVMRLYYRHYADEGFFHTFKAPGTRLFNNLVIPVKTQDEAKEQLRVVCEAFAAAQNLLKLELTIEEKTKLEKRKTHSHPEVMDIHQQLQENSLSQIKLPRDISSTDIPSQPDSNTSSPRMRHRLSPLLYAKNSSQTQNQSSPQESQDQVSGSKRSHQIGPYVNAKAAMVKSWMPKLNKPTAGSVELSVPKLNIKSLNLVGKLKTGREDASRLFSKVPGTSIFYKKDKRTSDTVDEPDVFINVDNTMKAPQRTQSDRKRTFSKDDSSLDESFEVTETDLEKEVVLDSCGILATSAKQILESPQYSVDEPDDNVEEVQLELESSVTEVKKDEQEEGEIVFDIGELQKAGENETKPTAEVGTSEVGVRRSAASFKCFCRETDSCPHKVNEALEDVWIKRTDVKADEENTPTSLDLSLGQKRVIDNSEADKILSKYSKAKQALSHPSMRNSMSDSAIAGKDITVAFTNVADDAESPKAVLEYDFEANPKLQKKLPNLLQSTKMPRKSHRIYESLKQHIEKQLCDQTCQSTIIFI
ncbi:uncharacterized protein LOC123546584 [Mercenaria mercenaria]|uniref:uncharacterized protein LOC123546584 n=1 Tax=Mercenaria mercenaria TaxID=6596 RepID=UPI00234E7E62|nr:uncharacterized protein LOC123546584 [Mercenaria mercenaria]